MRNPAALGYLFKSLASFLNALANRPISRMMGPVLGSTPQACGLHTYESTDTIDGFNLRHSQPGPAFEVTPEFV